LFGLVFNDAPEARPGKRWRAFGPVSYTEPADYVQELNRISAMPFMN
jgi:hypothetical protein